MKCFPQFWHSSQFLLSQPLSFIPGFPSLLNVGGEGGGGTYTKFGEREEGRVIVKDGSLNILSVKTSSCRNPGQMFLNYSTVE